MKRAWIMMTALVLILSQPLLAQRPPAGPPAGGFEPLMGPGMGLYDIPDLTPEQSSKIQKLELEFQKNTLPLHTQLQTKQLELRTLIIENAELSKLEAKIDEISKARAELMKKRIAHRLEIRKLLTDEQKAHFDLQGFDLGPRGGPRPGHIRGW
ncbi:MAG: Spy/CpxP family protein refolding chaperone [candidate division KSB1 bacterium]|nr:Spy/CpxP family protein refolding chaperone [candidate division KSB1 bacterium]